MGKRGRRQNRDKPIEWSVNIPESVANEVELLLSNPLTGKPVYGAKSSLLTTALREWLERHTGKEVERCPHCNSIITMKEK